MLGNFQHNPERIPRVRRSVEEMTKYFQSAIQEARRHPREGLIDSFSHSRKSTRRPLHGRGSHRQHNRHDGGWTGNDNKSNRQWRPDAATQSDRASKAPSGPDIAALRSRRDAANEPPSQHTARLAPDDLILGGKKIAKRQAAIAVMAAGNRDPERFPETDRFDISRKDNRHLSFGWAAHFCFGAALARIEGQVAFGAMLTLLSNWRLNPKPLVWRANLGLRGLTALPIEFDRNITGSPLRNPPVPVVEPTPGLQRTLEACPTRPNFRIQNASCWKNICGKASRGRVRPMEFARDRPAFLFPYRCRRSRFWSRLKP